MIFFLTGYSSQTLTDRIERSHKLHDVYAQKYTRSKIRWATIAPTSAITGDAFTLISILTRFALVGVFPT